MSIYNKNKINKGIKRMTYKEYLDQLDELFMKDYDLLTINNDEICASLKAFLDIFDKNDWQKMQDHFDAYRELIKIYTNVVVNELDSVADKSNLSIKKTLEILSQLVLILFGSVMILKDITDQVNAKLKSKPAFKKMVKGIDHYLQVNDEMQELIKKLNITYNDDQTKMQFDLSLISDKPHASIDFDKVLIPYNWVFLLPR